MAVFSLLKPRHATHVVSLRSHIIACAIFLVLSLPFVMAWWTTRKPSARRNVWAIVASLFYLAEGLLWFWMRHRFPAYTHGFSVRDGIYLAVIGVAGVILFSLRDAVSASELAAVKRAPIAGDRTHPLVYRAFTALSVVLQFGCMYLCGHWARSHGLLYRGRIPWLVLFTVAVLATAVLHECGHALIAWGFHMKLLGFNAGPMQWQKREGRWKFKFVPAGFINLGGAVRVVPTDAKQPRMHDLWMIAAGPLSNIFFGSIALYLLLCVHWPYYEQTWRLVAYTASFCYIAGITNLLPFMTEDGNYSDGARILQILTKSPLEEYHRTMDSLASTLVTERRYRDLDIEAIQRAAGQFPQELRGLFLQLCASNYYLDSGRISEARSALGSAEAIYNNNSIDLPGPLHTPFVIGHAYLNHNAAAARAWWERMEGKKFERNNIDYWLAQSALYWIEGRLKEAEEAWRKADAAAQSCRSSALTSSTGCAAPFCARNWTIHRKSQSCRLPPSSELPQHQPLRLPRSPPSLPSCASSSRPSCPACSCRPGRQCALRSPTVPASCCDRKYAQLIRCGGDEDSACETLHPAGDDEALH